MCALKRALFVAVLALLVTGVGAGGAQERLDFAGVALNVLPPGQAGDLAVGPNSTNQIALYDGLTPLGANVAQADLRRYFKSARFGVEGRPVRTVRPRTGVRIVRDRWGVPHVYGRTRADVEFGAGWATAEDRGLLLQLLRNAGRIAALDVPGVDAFSFALSGRGYRPSVAAEQQLTNIVALLRATRDGRQMLADINAYVAGINAYHRAQSLPIAPWRAADVAGIAALIGAVFGVGGGDETRRSMFRSALIDMLGEAKARNVFADLALEHDNGTPASIARDFGWEMEPQGARAAELADGSFEPVTYGVPPQQTHRLMSNAILIGRSRSATRRPLFVAGPQVGHFYPQILMELDLHGGGIDARGAAFPGLGFYVLLGRGKDYAWSLTSSTSDIVDDFAEVLCGDDAHYRYNGECREMGTFDAGSLLGSGGEPDRRLVFRTTVHGPVIGYARLRSGERVAISRKRSTRGRELLSGLAWQDLNTNKPRNAGQFLRSANKLEMSFNWFYADNRDIAMFSSGRLPLRETHLPGRLAFGTGEHEWRGFLPFARHPQVVNPSSGAIVNWNNKPARSFMAADDQWSYGRVHRVQLLTRGIESRATHTLASVVGVMNHAAAQDLRGIEVLPALEAVLGGATPPTPLAGEIFEILRAWREAGSSRLDADGDGLIDAPGAAVMDAAWPKLADAVMAPILGPLLPRLAQLQQRHDELSGGNAFGSGWYSYVETDLRTALGQEMTSAWRERYCGAGDLSSCRQSLWGAFDEAGRELVQRFGPDRSRWLTRDARIGYAPFLAASMRGTNRPTFQQVVMFTGHRSR